MIAILALEMGILYSRWAAGTNALTSQARKDFEWFSTLGFPDTKGCPYVRVATGEWSQSGDEPPQNRFVKAFLLATNAPNFRVLTLDLFDRTFMQTNFEAKAYTRVGFEVLGLSNEVTEVLHVLRNPPAKDDSWRRFGEQLTERGEVFTLAWACWRNGLNSEAQQLYEQAQNMPSRRGRDETASNFRETLEKNLGHAMMWRAVVNFENTSVFRTELLAQFESIVSNYPHSEHLERAKQTVGILKRMVSEDEMHAKLALTNFNQLPMEQQVRELIFRLRDQNGHQFSQPGSCDIFEDWRGTTNTPAHQLVKLGYAAVPQLIATLDDTTFSRSVGFHRNFYFSHTVLTVGDCAEAILQRITGKSFFESRSTYSYMSKDGETSAIRKAAESWWVEFQKKGEKQMLIEAITSPGPDAPAQAEILCRRYPEIAAATLIRGVQATTNSWIRTRLIEQVSKFDEPQVTNFLSREMLTALELQARVAAAYGLRDRGKAEAVQAMIHEWANLAGSKPHDDSGLEEVVHFLGSSDSVLAIQALGRDLRQRPVNTKWEVIECLGETDSFFSHRTAIPSTATLNAMEECLVTALEDTEERFRMSYGRNNLSVSDPRICDMAGFLLAERWPEHYSFDFSASLQSRNRQRVECMNVWRRNHNLPTLPIPQSRATRVKPEQATLVTAVEWAENSAKPSVDFAALVDSFRNKPLEISKLVSLLAGFAAKPDTQTSGIEFKAIKDEDLTGVLITVRLLRGTPPTESQGWDVNERVTLGRKSLHGSSGSGILSAYSATNQWDDFAEAAAKALAAEPKMPFEISVRLASGKITVTEP